jgi:OmpA-OmpF porin, OOP family
MCAEPCRENRFMRRSPLIFAVLSLFACGGLAWLIALSVVGRIEADTREQAITALAAAGQNWAAADPDGLKLVLSGEAPDEDARFSALEVIGRIIDAGRIVDRTTMASEEAAVAVPFSLEFQRSKGATALVGLVPGKDAAAALVSAVEQTGTGLPDNALLADMDADVPEHWQAAQAFALTLLPLVPDGTIRVTPGRVEVLALAASDAGRVQLEEKLMAGQPGDVTLTLKVSAPLPVVAPFRFAMRLENGVITFADCMAETPQDRALILSAVQRAGAAEMPRCNLALGAPAGSWPQAVDLAIAGLEELGGGSLSMADTDIAIMALPGTEQAQAERLRGDLEATLPPLFSVSITLPEEEPAGSAAPYRPLFSATLRPDGALGLSGVVADAPTLTAVEAYAASLLDQVEVQNRIKVDSRTPADWTGRVMAGLETLTLLNSGTLTVSPEKVYVEGRGASPDLEAEVRDALRARLGSDDAFSLLVVTDPSLSEVVTPPANTECATEINGILAGKQIAFAPNSAKIEPESAPVIDDIALVLKNCVTAAFEIGGHTDSKGGEVLNQALSQARADAVLDALLSRDVLVAHLTARGYGESQPIADNETEEGRARNRRIAFRLMESDREQD